MRLHAFSRPNNRVVFVNPALVTCVMDAPEHEDAGCTLICFDDENYVTVQGEPREVAQALIVEGAS